MALDAGYTNALSNKYHQRSLVGADPCVGPAFRAHTRVRPYNDFVSVLMTH